MEKKLLFAVLILGLILRLLGVVNISFSGDFAIHWKKANEILNLETNPFLGPNASINPNLYLGPFYYYLLIIFYLIGKGNFVSAIIFFSIINTFSIFILYKICKNWFTSGTALRITALFSVSSFVIISQNYPWNPHLLILLNLSAVYIIQKISEGKITYLTPLLLIMGLLLQAHATAILLFPFYLYFLPYKKLKLSDFLPGLGLILLTLVPWLLANLYCHNCQINELIKTLQPVSGNSCNFFQWLIKHGNGETCFQFIRNPLFILRLFSTSLFTAKNIIGLILSFLLIIWFIVKHKSKVKQFLLFWFLIPSFLFLFYNKNVYPHYFLIFLPLPFIFFVLFLDDIEKGLKHGKIISGFIYGVSFLANLISYLLSLGSMRL